MIQTSERAGMKTRAAVLWEAGKGWSIEEIDLDPPKADEVLVRLVGAGLCHSDEHLASGDIQLELPIIGGHEGAGVVEAVGSDVRTLAPGDHVVFGFIPSCGRCPSCVSGHQALCDVGMYLGDGMQISDHTARHHLNGRDLKIFLMLGSFAERTVVNEASCIKVDPDVPLDKACLLSCGVVTGWGSAVYGAEVRPGDDVAVVGIGGLGMSAVQGARLAGARQIFAIDPVEFKREKAMEFGATHIAASLEEAFSVVGDATYGRMCNKVIMTVGVGQGELIGPALAITAKRGRVVITNIHKPAETQVTMSALDLTNMEKQIHGCLFGSANPRVDIPRLLDLYVRGDLLLDEMITRTYSLDQINTGYQDMRDGRNIRGIIAF
jgi:S-(hydroxymethyl)glutathione dehydrogenase/alcohol dehydrogenase